MRQAPAPIQKTGGGTVLVGGPGRPGPPCLSRGAAASDPRN